MSIKIRHHSKTVFLTSISGIASIFVACLLSPLRRLSEIVGIASILVLGVTILYMVLLVVIRTTIAIDDDALTIRYPLLARTIPLSSIKAISFSHSSRVVKGSVVHRVILTLSVWTQDGLKQYALNDNATRYNGLIFPEPERIPDEDLSLYQVYQYLTDLTGLPGSIT